MRLTYRIRKSLFSLAEKTVQYLTLCWTASLIPSPREFRGDVVSVPHKVLFGEVVVDRGGLRCDGRPEGWDPVGRNGLEKLSSRRARGESAVKLIRSASPLSVLPSRIAPRAVKR
jgi:hypothetical protein